ncbi:MAG: hypothetical protein IKJ99_04545 [Oscillospiraceae bacterium]|nr:hypothetical protein [Oscillospiraceae bacterium]
MKKMLVFLVLAVSLAGCGRAEVFETVADEMLQSVMAQPREVRLELPEEAVLPAMETDNGTIYICKDYDVSVQTLESGDLEETVRSVSGFDPDDLTIMETALTDANCYEFVWTSAGEWKEQVCRCMILDDGNFHYVLTAMIGADLIEEYQEIWNGMFESFSLA